jgi:uncharacterized membrane protein (DUF485 family)
MEAIEIGSAQMPLNTVGNSVTFNKKLLLQAVVATAILAGIYLYYNHLEKQQLKQLINTKKSS